MTDRQNIAVLGATGSIGSSTLALLQAHPERYQIYALSGHRRLDALFELCVRHRPMRVAVPAAAQDEFAQRLQAADINCDVVAGASGLDDIASDAAVHTVVAGIVGAAGLASTLAAAKAGKRILLANKEALVMAGDLLINQACAHQASLLPIDSEHNAIFQCLPPDIQANRNCIDNPAHGIASLWLTASGGPFLDSSYEQMQVASVADAVKHPNWSMGQKISVDSATMMNKGLELIEACHLFALPESRIEVVIHPQSIVHSLVEYVDGSLLAQLGSPDMKTPIAHALAYPERIRSGVQRLDLHSLSQLEFSKPDLTKFACLKLAREAMRTGSWASISLNAANEVAVAAFLSQHIALTDIAHLNEQVVDKMSALSDTFSNGQGQIEDLAAIMAVDAQARHIASQALATRST